MKKEEILEKVDRLIKLYKEGRLGGEVMPEDANPSLEKSSVENYLYFTLPMALNYQRNSYKLWESALKTYKDEETNFVFNPKLCLKKTFEEVQYALTKYKVFISSGLTVTILLIAIIGWMVIPIFLESCSEFTTESGIPKFPLEINFSLSISNSKSPSSYTKLLAIKLCVFPSSLCLLVQIMPLSVFSKSINILLNAGWE